MDARCGMTERELTGLSYLTNTLAYHPHLFERIIQDFCIIFSGMTRACYNEVYKTYKVYESIYSSDNHGSRKKILETALEKLEKRAPTVAHLLEWWYKEKYVHKEW